METTETSWPALPPVGSRMNASILLSGDQTGGYRTRIPAYASGGHAPPEHAGEEALSYVEQGFRALKMRVGGMDAPRQVEGSIARIRAVREAVGPEVELMLDAHGSLNTSTAIRLARRAEPFEVAWFEEPTASDNWAGMAEVRAATTIPIATGENDFTAFDFRDIIDNEKIFIANLSGLSDIEAETLGALLISKFQVAAMSRGASSLVDSSDFYLYIDEVQSFITTSLPTAYSESSKYGLRLVTANQYMGQLEGRTLGAIMRNVGSTIIFRVGARDANALAPFVQPQFDPRDLVNLSRFNAVVKAQFLGETIPAFNMETLSPIITPADAYERIRRIRELSRNSFAQPREQVEAEFRDRYGNDQRGPYAQSISGEDGEDDYFG